MRRTARGSIVVVVATLLAVGALGACSEPLPDDQAGPTSSPDRVASTEACSADLFACAQDTVLADYLPAEPTKATGEPIVLGMVNQENTAAGSYVFA